MGKIKIVFFLIVLGAGAFGFCDELTPKRGFYGRMDFGFSEARDPGLKITSGPLPADLGSSFLFGGGLGYTYVPGLRGDFTVTYRSGFQQISGFSAMPEGTADLKSLTALASVYLDLISKERFSPYVGFGLGISRVELGNINIKNVDGSFLGGIAGAKKNNFAWQVCVGGSFMLRNNLLLDAGYHYLSAGDYQSQDTLTLADGTMISAKNRGEFRAHEFITSLQIVF
jgi:opacity protein-like surface antigen